MEDYHYLFKKNGNRGYLYQQINSLCLKYLCNTNFTLFIQKRHFLKALLLVFLNTLNFLVIDNLPKFLSLQTKMLCKKGNALTKKVNNTSSFIKWQNFPLKVTLTLSGTIFQQVSDRCPSRRLLQNFKWIVIIQKLSFKYAVVVNV